MATVALPFYPYTCNKTKNHSIWVNFKLKLDVRHLECQPLPKIIKITVRMANNMILYQIWPSKVQFTQNRILSFPLFGSF